MNYVQGGDNGTPLQKDVPHAENPPEGAVIDYYLKSAVSGPVTLAILDTSGKVLHTFSSEEPEFAAGSGGGGRRRGGIPNVSPLWQPAPPEPLSTHAGMHRIVWLPVADTGRGRGRGGGGGGFRSRGPRLTGSFTAKLTVNGRSYTQDFVVKPDPRGGEVADDDAGDDM